MRKVLDISFNGRNYSSVVSHASFSLDEIKGIIEECAGVDLQKIKDKGARHHKYNTSRYHDDFVFGNDSITIEAETKNQKKVLLMEKGIWKI